MGGQELWDVASRGDTRRVKKLLQTDGRKHIEYRSGTYGSTPLYIASQNGHTETVITLLERGA